MGATATDIEKVPSAGTPDEPKAGETNVYVDTEAEKSFGMLIEWLMINESEGTRELLTRTSPQGGLLCPAYAMFGILP